MADVSPGGVPDQGATPPAPEAPTSALPASAAPAPPPFPGAPAPGAEPAAHYPGLQFPGAQLPGPQFSGARPEGAADAYAAAYSTGAFPPVPSEASASAPDAWRDPATGRARGGWRRWLPIGGVITLILAGAVGMLLFLGVNFGGVALLVGIIAAVIPVPLLVAAFLWLDRYEPEPMHLLAFCFAWGATVATSVALLVNTGAAWLFDKAGLSTSLVAVLVAPLIEESMKASGPLLVFWRRREEWSGITDGIVYCGLSALGFAMVENVLYLGGHGYAAGAEKYGAATGLQNVFAIFIVRILFTGFAHPLFTSMTGIGLGISSRSGDRRVRWLAPIAGLLVAMMLHGTFNLLPTLSVSLSQPFIMLYGYLGFMVPFFFAVVGFAIALRAWEGRIAERILPFYVRTGWFAPPEVAALGSLGRRYSARQWARRVAGPAGQRAMKGFQFAATQLALLRDGMQRGLHRTPVSVARAEAEEQRLLAAIVDYRSTFTGRDPQMPQAFWNGDIYQIAFPDGVTRAVRPPEEPVVPVPIRFNQAAYAGYGIAGYGITPGAQPTPGYGPTPQAYAHPPVSAPSFGAPPAGGYGAPAYGPPPASGVPAYGPPQAPGVPIYGPSGSGAPAYGPSGSGAPAYGPSASGAPAYGPSASGPPAQGGPSYHPTPGHGTSAYGAPVNHGAPGYGSPSHGAPNHSAPGYGTPGYGTPGYGTPGYGTPGYATPEQGVSGQGVSGQGVSGQGTPGYGEPGYGAPSQGTPGYGSPSHGAPVHGVPSPSAEGQEAPSQSGSGYAAPSPSAAGYQAPTPSGAGYQAPTPSAAGYQAPSPSGPAYGAPSPSAASYQATSSSEAGHATLRYGAPGQGASGYQAPGQGVSGHEAPRYGAPGENGSEWEAPDRGEPAPSSPPPGYGQAGPGHGPQAPPEDRSS